jgi:hypothetical protein
MGQACTTHYSKTQQPGALAQHNAVSAVRASQVSSSTFIGMWWSMSEIDDLTTALQAILPDSSHSRARSLAWLLADIAHRGLSEEDARQRLADFTKELAALDGQQVRTPQTGVDFAGGEFGDLYVQNLTGGDATTIHVNLGITRSQKVDERRIFRIFGIPIFSVSITRTVTLLGTLIALGLGTVAGLVAATIGYRTVAVATSPAATELISRSEIALADSPTAVLVESPQNATPIATMALPPTQAPIPTIIVGPATQAPFPTITPLPPLVTAEVPTLRPPPSVVTAEIPTLAPLPSATIPPVVITIEATLPAATATAVAATEPPATDVPTTAPPPVSPTTGPSETAGPIATATVPALATATLVPVPTTVATASSVPAQLYVQILNYDDAPDCISVQIIGISTAGWFFRVDGLELLAAFDAAGAARRCGLPVDQSISVSIFDNSGSPVPGGSGFVAQGSAILLGEWR